MSESNIQIRNLSKSYGRKQALCGLNLDIASGMFGLLGRNGAGKTTLMKTIATLLKKQEGDITVCGVPVEKAAEIRKIVGYLLQDFNMYGDMSVTQALDYLGVVAKGGSLIDGWVYIGGTGHHRLIVLVSGQVIPQEQGQL